MNAPTPLDVALRLLEAGLSVLPISTEGLVPLADGKYLKRFKTPHLLNRAKWERLQTERFTTEEALLQFGRHVGIGIIAGAISGNLEILDIEGRAPLHGIFDLIEMHAPGLLVRLTIVGTPSGGRHLFYRCSAIEGNQQLAMAPSTEPGPKAKVLIETRGEGGYVLTFSSPAECHESGGIYTLLQGRLTEIPTITPEEREILLTCCRSFNTYVKPANTVSLKRSFSANDVVGRRPGDDYNKRGNPLEVLLKHQWTISHKSGDTVYLSRPGKDGGVSATFGHVAPNVLYVFSSNAQPLDFGRGYDAFGIVSTLEYGGDTAAAAKALSSKGYGQKRSDPVSLLSLPPAPTNGNGSSPHATSIAITAPTSPDAPATPTVLDNGNTLQAMAQMTNPTEDAVAALFEHAYKDNLRYVKSWGTWLTWEQQRWKQEKTALAFDQCRRLARMVNLEGAKSVAKASFARGVESFAQAARTFATETSQWDKDEFLLATEGGTVDLRTNTIQLPLQTDYITKMCRVAPSSGTHPVFDRFMRDICLEDEALIRYHQKSLGSILSGARTDHWILFWIGTGRNGKNTLGDLVAWILGDYARVIPSETLMSVKSNRHPTDLATLRGLRLAMSSEVEEGSYWNEARIKSLTGDEQISARFIAQDFFEFPRTHKHLVFGNNRPMLRVVDEAMKSRLHVVPFKADFSGKAGDPDMPRKLRQEAPQVLQWLLDGHEMWMEDGSLQKCSAVQDETDLYFESQSTPEMWVAEMCLVTDPDHRSTSSELYASFKLWKENRGEKPMSQSRWGEWMSIRYRKVKSNGTPTYEGIRLNPDLLTKSDDRQFWGDR